MNINNILRKANFRMTMASAPFPVSLHKDIAVVLVYTTCLNGIVS